LEGDVKIGIIGCGHWGFNYIRVFRELENAEVAGCSDVSDASLRRAGSFAPGLKLFKNYRELLELDTDAIVVSTPASTHYEIARECLKSGKHLLVEKPFVLKPEEGEDLIDLAEKSGLTLMVGHVFEHNSGVNKIKESIGSGALGRIYYLHSTRTNLGPVRKDVNAVWDLASHDISIFSYVLGRKPVGVSAKGASYIQEDLKDVAFITLDYPDKVVAHIHVSWLDPQKVRRITVIGEKKMLFFDDMNNLEPIRIYDKGFAREPLYSTFGEFQTVLRDGDVTIPSVKLTEPLKSECMHFLMCVKDKKKPVTDGRDGVNVVRVLAAIDESLKQRGKTTEIKW